MPMSFRGSSKAPLKVMSKQPAWRTNLTIPCGHERRLRKTARFVRHKNTNLWGKSFGALMFKEGNLPQRASSPYGSKS